MSDEIKVLNEQGGTPKPFTVPVYVRQPSSVPEAVVRDQAHGNLFGAVQAYIDGINSGPFGLDLHVVDVVVDRIDVAYSSHTNPVTQERHSEAKGTATGHGLCTGLP